LYRFWLYWTSLRTDVGAKIAVELLNLDECVKRHHVADQAYDELVRTVPAPKEAGDALLDWKPRLRNSRRIGRPRTKCHAHDATAGKASRVVTIGCESISRNASVRQAISPGVETRTDIVDLEIAVLQ